MSASIDMTRLIRGAGQMRARAMAAAQSGLDVAGEHVLGDAAQLAPVETGALKASATAEPAAWKADRLEKVIGFNTEYAAAVHEVLTARHDAPTQAKYLETALRQSGPKACEYAANKVREAMG
jgi:hypothetical protein